MTIDNDFVDVFFNTGLLEEDAIFTIDDDDITLKGIFRNEFRIEELDRMQLESQSPNIFVKTSEITGIEQNTIVNIRNENYKVSSIRDDSDGFTLIILKKYV